MFKIRRNVFETNSSSTHAIMISADAISEDITQEPIIADEYGWGVRVLKTSVEKLEYLYTSALESMIEVDDGNKIVTDEFNKHFNTLFSCKSSYFIDHQSVNQLFYYAYVNKQLEQYFDFIGQIVYGEYVIHITNDNFKYYEGWEPGTYVYTSELVDAFKIFTQCYSVDKAIRECYGA